MTNIVQHVFSWKMMKKLHMKIGAFWPQQLLGRFSGLEIPPLSKKIREGKRRGGEGREGDREGRERKGRESKGREEKRREKKKISWSHAFTSIFGSSDLEFPGNLVNSDQKSRVLVSPFQVLSKGCTRGRLWKAEEAGNHKGCW